MSSILRITDPISSNEGIDKYEYFECEPVVGTNLNNSGGTIRLYIETQDIFTHSSFLLIEGRLTKGDGAAYADANKCFSSKQRYDVSF